MRAIGVAWSQDNNIGGEMSMITGRSIARSRGSRRSEIGSLASIVTTTCWRLAAPRYLVTCPWAT